MDLNTLISNIVTSTAALVAIIGGFLISRVIITLSSGKTGVKRKLNEVKNDVFAKEEMFKKIEQDILDEDAEDFIDYNYKDLLFNEKYFEEIVGIEGFRNRILVKEFSDGRIKCCLLFQKKVSVLLKD
jgi:hypothetical protein